MLYFLNRKASMLLRMNRALLAASLFAISLVCSAQAPCDVELLHQADPNDKDRYSQREKDRCEGVYLQNVSSTVGQILVASVTATSGGPWQWPAGGRLALHWNQFSNGDVHIQAFPLVPQKHYRLDVLTRAVSTYEWNTDLVAKHLAPDQTGLVAWTIAAINGNSRRVYLPMRVGTVGATNGPYRLTLVPPAELSEVYVTVASVVSGENPLQVHKPLRYGFYPANRKIEVDLPPLPKSGLYRVELIGDRRNSGSVTTPPFLINHIQ